MLLRDYVVDKGLCFVNFYLYRFIFKLFDWEINFNVKCCFFFFVEKIKMFLREFYVDSEDGGKDFVYG